MKRRSRVTHVGQVLPSRYRGSRHTWQALVGATLGGVTVLVGVSPEGKLRVMARNEAARSELAARAAHVLSAWNAVARTLGARQALELECWVNLDLKPQAPVERSPRAPVRPPDQALVTQAEADIRGVTDAALRSALVRARAKHLQRSAASAESPAERAARGGEGETRRTGPDTVR